MNWQLVGIVVAIVGGLFVPIGLAIHAAGRARSERNVKRLDDHIVEDVKAHERLVRLETKVDQLDVEVRTMRERYHDFRDSLTRYLSDKVNEAVALIRREK